MFTTWVAISHLLASRHPHGLVRICLRVGTEPARLRAAAGSSSTSAISRSVAALVAARAHLLSGITGRTVRPNVELVTAANDAYQAAAAVASPTYPPHLMMSS